MDFYYGGYGGYGYGGWYSGREKSRHSKNREDNAKNKFDGIRNKIQTAMIENTMIELRTSKNDTPLKAVPTVVMNNVLSFVFGKNYKGLAAEKEQSVAVAAAAAASSKSAGTGGGRRARKKINYSEMNVDKMGNDLSKTSKAEVEADIDFNDMTLYEPGNKVTIPLTRPDYHLTQPCFRDLRKHVKKNPGWDLHRVALSEEEKKAHKPKITRKSTAYFVNAVYKVPGKKKKAKKAPSSKKAPAKKAPAKKRKAPTKPVAKKPIAKADPEKVAKLQAAIASARSSSDGEVGAKEMQEALAAGYSKFFILAQLEEEEESGDEKVEDSKPAAKKTKKSA